MKFYNNFEILIRKFLFIIYRKRKIYILRFYSQAETKIYQKDVQPLANDPLLQFFRIGMISSIAVIKFSSLRILARIIDF